MFIVQCVSDHEAESSGEALSRFRMAAEIQQHAQIVQHQQRCVCARKQTEEKLHIETRKKYIYVHTQIVYSEHLLGNITVAVKVKGIVHSKMKIC